MYVHTCYSRRRAVSAPPPPPGPGQGRPGLVSPPGLILAVTQFSWARSLVLKDLGRRGRAGDSASAKSGYNPGPGTIMIYLRGSQSRAATNFVYRRGVALACETYHALLLLCFSFIRQSETRLCNGGLGIPPHHNTMHSGGRWQTEACNPIRVEVVDEVADLFAQESQHTVLRKIFGLTRCNFIRMQKDRISFCVMSPAPV